MTEDKNSCERTCIAFGGLPDKVQNQNRGARIDAQQGKDLPGLENTLCGHCVGGRKNQTALEEEMKKPFIYKPQKELQKVT